MPRICSSKNVLEQVEIDEVGKVESAMAEISIYTSS